MLLNQSECLTLDGVPASKPLFFIPEKACETQVKTYVMILRRLRRLESALHTNLNFNYPM